MCVCKVLKLLMQLVYISVQSVYIIYVNFLLQIFSEIFMS